MQPGARSEVLGAGMVRGRRDRVASRRRTGAEAADARPDLEEARVP